MAHPAAPAPQLLGRSVLLPRAERGGLQRGLPWRAAPVLALPGPGSEPGARLRALAPRHDGPQRRRGALVPPPGAGNGLVGLGGRRGALRRRSATPPRPEPPPAHRRVLV